MVVFDLEAAFVKLFGKGSIVVEVPGRSEYDDILGARMT